jgi:hypothetical protein
LPPTKAIQKLKSIRPSETQITDQALSYLAELKSLEAVHLNQTKVTAEGVKKLHAALPQCRIHSDFGVLGPQD